MRETDAHFGMIVSDVARLLRTDFDRRVRTVGLTRSQWLVLARLRRAPGCSQSELADLMEVEKATAGRLLDRLEDKGWIRREPDARDRRVRRVFLTPAAEGMRRTIDRIAGETVNNALGDLTADERKDVTALLVRVKERLAGTVQGNGSDRPARMPAGPRREATVK